MPTNEWDQFRRVDAAVGSAPAAANEWDQFQRADAAPSPRHGVEIPPLVAPPPSTKDAKTGLDPTAAAYRLGPDDAPYLDRGAAPGYVEQFAGGAKHALDRAAMGLKGIFTDLTPEDKQLLEQGEQFVKQTGKASTLGQIAGDIGITAPAFMFGGAAMQTPRIAQTINALRGMAPVATKVGGVVADVAANAGVSAALAPEDRGQAALMGGGGALAGRVLNRAVAGLRPYLSKDVAALSDAGVALTPGQMAGQSLPGRMIRGAEDKATSIPLVGDIIKNARSRSIADFGRAEINAALAPLGKSVKGTGADAVDLASRHVSDAYEEALKHINIPKANFDDAMGQMRVELEGLPLLDAQQLAQLEGFVGKRLSPQFHHSDTLSGQNVKALDSEIGHFARKFTSSPNPTDHPLGEAFYVLQSRWREAMDAPGNPGAKQLLDSANKAFKALLPITLAAERDAHGVFTPAVLKQAARRINKTGDPTELTTAAARVLPSTVPDSGSAGRMLQGAIVGGLGGAATGTLPHLIGGGAVAGVGYSELALKALAGNTALQKWYRAQPDTRLALEQIGRAIAARQVEVQPQQGQ